MLRMQISQTITRLLLLLKYSMLIAYSLSTILEVELYSDVIRTVMFLSMSMRMNFKFPIHKYTSEPKDST